MPLKLRMREDLRSLISFFIDVQKRALFQATQTAADITGALSVDDAIAAAKRILVESGNNQRASYLDAGKIHRRSTYGCRS